MSNPIRILQLGAGELMKHSIRQIQELGYEVYAIDKNPDAPAASVADGFNAIDLVDVEAITQYARDIGASAIIAVNEAGVLSASSASQTLGLKNVLPAVAQRALDKGMMRNAWAEANLTQPDYRILEHVDEIPDAVTELGYPVIIKPTLNWGSRGISLVSSPDDLAWSMAFAEKNQRNGKLIVEQFIDGIEITLEGLVQDSQVSILAWSDKEHQPHPRFRVAMGLNYPARFDDDVKRTAFELVENAVKAIGIENGAFHVEAIVTKNQVYLVELGARPGGGHIFGQIVEAASGVVMPQVLTQIFLNQPVNINPIYQHGACYRFFAPPSGIFHAVHGLEKARDLQGVLDMGFHMPSGARVTSIEGDADRPGYLVTTAPTREEAIQIADNAIQMLHFEMSDTIPHDIP